ncbi:hypothetical protein OBBRIDRAFT_176561 [Obba rivulosa]|uniref:RING-type domain-containing protein n=1 Tax=Obba rivulosa TaxID=1052685 RepID=A0A8E2APR7_9APHY|nr:hypothetical protein OBBRIDRAFT_176561 [Obba rivulosa]
MAVDSAAAAPELEDCQQHAAAKDHPCHWRFFSGTTLDLHRTQPYSLTGSNQRSFSGPVSQRSCTSCSLVFATTAALQEHQRLHASTFPNTDLTPTSHGLGFCTECCSDFRSVMALAQHYQLSVTHPKCPRCNRGMKNLDSLSAHIRLYHRIVHCDPCSTSFPSDQKQHHFDTSPKHPKCTRCKIGFETDRCFVEHQALKHQITQYVPYRSSNALYDRYKDSTTHPYYATCALSFAESDIYEKCAAVKQSSQMWASCPQQGLEQNVKTVASDSQPDIAISKVAVSVPSTVYLHHRSRCDEVVANVSLIAPQSIQSSADVAASLQANLSVSDSKQLPSVPPSCKDRAPPLERGESSQDSGDHSNGAYISILKNEEVYAEQPITAPTTPKQSIWHCSICQQTPCREPTATMCGHVFCHDCIITELATNHQCPVCKKLMLVRLCVDDP